MRRLYPSKSQKDVLLQVEWGDENVGCAGGVPALRHQCAAAGSPELCPAQQVAHRAVTHFWTLAEQYLQ